MPSSDGTETTPDGHHIVVDGRRWRATDPHIPEGLRVELVAELMAARRAVRDAADDDAVAAARARVHDAKVALGERGAPWWEPVGPEVEERLAAAVRTLLRHRRPDVTICPSDAARVAGGESWRDLMDAARRVSVALESAGVVEVRQRGTKVDPGTARGPLRLARGPAFPC